MDLLFSYQPEYSFNQLRHVSHNINTKIEPFPLYSIKGRCSVFSYKKSPPEIFKKIDYVTLVYGLNYELTLPDSVKSLTIIPEDNLIQKFKLIHTLEKNWIIQHSSLTSLSICDAIEYVVDCLPPTLKRFYGVNADVTIKYDMPKLASMTSSRLLLCKGVNIPKLRYLSVYFIVKNLSIPSLYEFKTDELYSFEPCFPQIREFDYRWSDCLYCVEHPTIRHLRGRIYDLSLILSLPKLESVVVEDSHLSLDQVDLWMKQIPQHVEVTIYNYVLEEIYHRPKNEKWSSTDMWQEI